METKKTSKERLIEASGYLFRVRGYHNTSIADIANACNLRKASIYHHINSKQELGIAVLQQLNQNFEETIFAIAYDETRARIERLKAFAFALEQFFKDRQGGCLMANLSLESVDTIAEFEELIRRYFDNCINAITHLIQHQYGLEKARQLALDYVATLQGAILLSRIYKSPEALIRFRDQLIGLLDPKLEQ
ncbi:MAG: TetR/AcrR family transcriptional regulator [Legionellales bacterium]|nr:TetR/AcrR family transcriptional regulator [Legionellales bacterium]